MSNYFLSVLILVSALQLPDGSFAQRMDLTFIVDGSGSVHDQVPTLWIPQRDLIMRILRELNIARENVRVAMVTFASSAVVRWNLDEYSERGDIKKGVLAMTFSGGRSNLHEAFTTVRTKVFGDTPGNRPGVRDVVIVFSDGHPTQDIELAETSAEDLRSDNIEMFSIGIGDRVKQFTLNYMSTNQDYTYNMTDLADPTKRLIYSTFITKLLGGSALPTPVPDPCASSPCMNNGVCSSENPYEWGYSCHCMNKAGGRLCQMDDPCKSASCPVGTRLCLQSSSNDVGRYCYDKNYNPITENSITTRASNGDNNNPRDG